MFPAKKNTFLNSSYVIYGIVLLDNRQSTFRNTLLISYSTVDKLIFRSMKMCFQLYTEKPITNYPLSRRHIYVVLILNAVDRIQNGTDGLEARVN